MSNFINNTQDLKRYTGGAVNASFAFESLAHEQPIIVERHLLPLLGQPLLTSILAAIEDAPLWKAKQRFAAAVAYLLLSEYSDIGAVQLSGAGIVRVETAETKSAYRYQEERYRNSVRAKGHDLIELGLMNLDSAATATPALLPLFIASPASKVTRGQLVVWADDVRRFFGAPCDRYTFNTLSPLFRSLERQAILPLLGRTTYEQLMTHLANDTLEQAQHFAVLADLLREALCAGVLAEAQRRQLVSVADGRVSLAEKPGAQADTQQTTPTGPQLAIARQHLLDFELRGLTDVRAHLAANKPLFAAYWLEQDALTVALPVDTVVNHGGVVSI